MGNFYTNITLRGPQQGRVVEFLNQQGRNAYVSPTTGSFTVVCDEKCEEQDITVLQSLASSLSAQFNCPALALLNHDDDILVYTLYSDGTLVDEYDSSPSYFDPDAEPSNPIGGDAIKLCQIMGKADNVAEVENILRRSSHEDDGFVFEIERHEALVRALGLPAFSIGLGYTYIEQDEIPEGLDAGSLIRSV